MSAAIRLPLARLVTVPRRSDLDLLDLLAEAEGDRLVAQVELQRLDDLGVAEVEHLRALLDHGHAGAERGEHRGVLDADHAGADHDHASWAPACIASTPSESSTRSSSNSTCGGRAGRVPVAMTMFSAVTVLWSPRAVAAHGDGVRVVEARGAAEDVDVVAQQLVADHLHLAPDDVRGAGQQVVDGDVGLDPVAGAVHVALREAGQVQHGLAQRLRRDRAGVDADAAHHVAPLDDRDPLAQLGGGDGGLLPARSRADHQQVVVVHGVVPFTPAYLHVSPQTRDSDDALAARRR